MACMPCCNLQNVAENLPVPHPNQNCCNRALHHYLQENSTAFVSAPRREADSQSVRQAVSHAVSWASRQADKQTQPSSLSFSSDGLGYKQWGARVR